MDSFRLTGLSYAPFAPLFEMNDDRLADIGIVRMRADSDHGYPCRVSLANAEVGAELLLLPFEHLPATSPYRASGPIFVRRGAAQCLPAPGEIPPYVTQRRLISVRAYDEAHMMVGAEVCTGTDAGAGIERWLADEQTSYIHLHNAQRGCFLCRADRMKA